MAMCDEDGKWKIISKVKGGGRMMKMMTFLKARKWNLSKGREKFINLSSISPSHNWHCETKPEIHCYEMKSLTKCGGWERRDKQKSSEKKFANSRAKSGRRKKASKFVLNNFCVLENSLMALWNHKLQVIDYFFHNSFFLRLPTESAGGCSLFCLPIFLISAI